MENFMSQKATFFKTHLETYQNITKYAVHCIIMAFTNWFIHTQKYTYYANYSVELALADH